MNKRLFRRILFTAIVLAWPAWAADWPQWRGPFRDGISKETGLLAEWPIDGPRLVWQSKEIGYGYSTPAVVGDRFYLLANKLLDPKTIDMESEFVQAHAVADGRQIWSTRLGKVGPNQQPNYAAARSTPTVDGDGLYALGSDGDLACLDRATGTVRWQKNLRTAFDGRPGKWAYAESPLIDGELLVCTPGGDEATIVALKKSNGDLVWKSAVPGGDDASYSSIVIAEAAGRKQYVQYFQKGHVGIDAKTGQFLWRYEQTGNPAGMANIPTPVAHNGFVYSGVPRGFGALIRLKADAGGMTAEQVYFERGLPNAIGGAVLVGEYLYGTSGQGLQCVEFATGKMKWKDKCVGAASICCAEGRLYVHSVNGPVALVEAAPEAYREKGRFTPPAPPEHIRGGMEKAWAYPVVANGRLYIRDAGTLWCYDVRK